MSFQCLFLFAGLKLSNLNNILSAQYIMNQQILVKFAQILELDYKLIRFWWPGPNLQGHIWINISLWSHETKFA